eukprot:GHVL01027400.1.p1 GENE.GHVL01027400.1~~GHVL01027400.1.p1  ORF type:complete len:457 (-),score=110.74 GHVL01027400.1:72-1412(-)
MEKKAVNLIANHMPRGLTKFSDLIIDSGKGVYVYDISGKKYMDFSSGIGVTSLGHCHPKIVEAAIEQTKKIIHAQQNCFLTHTAQVKCLEKLLPILPKNLKKVVFANSGAEAVENCIKIARQATRRPNIVAFDGGFHGRTMGAMALTTSKVSYRRHFQPLMGGVLIAPYPYCYKCPIRLKKSDTNKSDTNNCDITNNFMKNENLCCNDPIEQIKDIFIKRTDPTETAAMIIEPILGEGGFIPPPPQFLKFLRNFCDENGIILIFDEVQSGVGRSGRWWSHEIYNIEPDILTFAKGIATGFPMAGVAMKSEIEEKLLPNSLGGTFAGNAVGSAVAAAAITVFEEENILSNVQQRGKELISELRKISKKHKFIGDVRGAGLMLGLEFTPDAPPGIASQISKKCVENGLLLITAGSRETLRFLPPLIINKEEVLEGLAAFEKTLNDLGY